jgi:hypothetical protein
MAVKDAGEGPAALEAARLGGGGRLSVGMALLA